MTTDKQAIVMKPGTIDYYVVVNVTGEYKGSMDDFKWESNSNKITVNSFGNYALVSSGSQEGEAEITVSNGFCDGLPLRIKVVIGQNLVVDNGGNPYIYAPRNVYTMTRGGPNLLIPLEVKGVNPVRYDNFTVSNIGSAVQCTFSNGNIIVADTNVGAATLRITYSGINYVLVLYVIVQENNESAAAYLTTGQNYVIVQKNSTKVVDISLVNYTEPDSGNFSWWSDNGSIAHVIGNGQTVQILGMDIGVTKVTVSHQKAYNNLDIIVKVIPAGANETVCYLTTNDNVVETYISSAYGQLLVSKVGGVTPEVDAAWSVDNPTIVSVMGNNSIGYYTPKKAGIARITVTDKEAGSISMVIIVRKSRPGDGYLSTSESIVQISPGTTGRSITVDLSNGEEEDEKNFRWEIYTQIPSDVDVARDGGSVISMYAMGSRASIDGIYAGLARIKVTHPKAAEALYIVAQVTHFQKMQFAQRSISMETEDMQFVTLETPDYENYTGKVQYATDNPAVCTVYGSSKAALLSTHQSGKAVITAYVEDTDLLAEITVNVFAERAYDEPYIITPKTMFVLGPRELPFLIEAQIFGVGVTEQDRDSLIWTVKNNEKNMIKIYPENVVENGVVKTNKSKGHMIQVAVQNRRYDNTESCTIEISCPGQTSRVKTIFLQIQEDSNAFTLSKYEFNNIDTGTMVELSCNIIGGKSKDYDEVVWMADKDSFDPTKDLVKIMGKGQKVNILPLSDGITQITAMYRGLVKTCSISIKSSVYINIQYQTYLTYPGDRNRNKETKEEKLLEIEYEVRPAHAYIQWITTNTNFEKPAANVSFTEAEEKIKGTGTGKIILEPLNEGEFVIMAVSNQKTAKMNVIVKNVYRFNIDNHFINEYPNDWPYVWNNDKEKASEIVKKASTTVKYLVSPPNVSIVAKEPTEAQLIQMGIRLDISMPKRTPDGMRAEGTIYFKCEKETTYPVSLVFEILGMDGKRVGKEQEITLIIRYPQGQARLVPVLQPIYGNFTRGTSSYSGSGSPKGQMYKAGEFLNKVTVPNGPKVNGLFEDTYSLDVGDGEEAYILLDRINPNAKIENITLEPFNPGNYLGGQGRCVSAKQVLNENGEVAIQISGGKDYIVYSRFGSEWNLYVSLESDRPNIDGKFVYAKKGNAIKGYNGGLLDNIGDSYYGYILENGSDQKYITMKKEEFNNKYYYVDGAYYYKSGNNYLPTQNIDSGNSSNHYPKYWTSAIDYYDYEYDYGKAPYTLWYPYEDRYVSDNPYNAIRLMVYMNAGGSESLDFYYINPYITSSYSNNTIFNRFPKYKISSTIHNLVNSFYVDLFGYKNGYPSFENNIITRNLYEWNQSDDPSNDTPTRTIPGKIRFYSDDFAYDYGSGSISLANDNNYKVNNGLPDNGGYIKPLYNTKVNYKNDASFSYIDIGKKVGYDQSNKKWTASLEVIYKYPIGNKSIYNNRVVKVFSMVNPIWERYDPKDMLVLHGKYDPLSTDPFKSDNTNNNYRFYPMPSRNTAIAKANGNGLEFDNIGLLKIKYATSYGNANYLNIIINHIIRQCHANFDGNEYKQAESWNDTVQKKRNEIFKDRIVDDMDYSENYRNGTLLIDKTY
jgi:hypothetical protein